MIYLLELLTNDHNSMLHTKKAISYDIQSISFDDGPRLYDLFLIVEARLLSTNRATWHTN